MLESPTNSSKPKSRKLSQRLTERQYLALKKHVPDRMRQQFFDILINGLIELFESPVGPHVIGAIASGQLEISTILDASKKKDEQSD